MSNKVNKSVENCLVKYNLFFYEEYKIKFIISWGIKLTKMFRVVSLNSNTVLLAPRYEKVFTKLKLYIVGWVRSEL